MTERKKLKPHFFRCILEGRINTRTTACSATSTNVPWVSQNLL